MGSFLALLKVQVIDNEYIAFCLIEKIYPNMSTDFYTGLHINWLCNFNDIQNG